MWKYYTPDELYHYGILGMKWGHRKHNILSKIKNEYKNYKEANKNDKSVKAANIIGTISAIGSGGIYGFSQTSGIETSGMKKAQKALSTIGNISFGYSASKSLYNYGKFKKNQNNKTNNKNKPMSIKKKILIGSTITAGIIGGAIATKKISNYVKSKNREIATMKGWKEYFKNINKGKSFKESISKYYNITNKANNDNFRTSLMNVIKSR